jgi:capsular polysaccharide biosynthesis protein
VAEPAPIPEPDEVTLADIVRVLWRRRFVLLALFLLAVAGAVAYTLLKDPVYESKATVVAVEQQDVIQHWLQSRQAALWVSQRLGDPLLSRLFEDEWTGSGWSGGPPGPERAGRAVADLVEVSVAPRTAQQQDRSIQVQVATTDAGLARDVANAYIASLEVIRPQLQNVTESQLFVQFYDGQNEPDARRQARQVALEREYWIVVDPAFAADRPSSPNVPLNLALGVVLGLLLGVVGAFFAEWLASYRVSSRAPAVPEAPAAAPGSSTFRYRGR